MRKKPFTKRPIKTHCEQCLHTTYYATGEYILKNVFLVIRNLAVMIGLFAIILFIIFPGIVVDTITSTMLTVGTYDTAELRSVSIAVTEDCDEGVVSQCYALGIFNHLKDIRYVPASYYRTLEKPEYVYDFGGDCKHLSMLYVTMMRSVGINAFVSCNQIKEHCIAVVPNSYNYERYPGFLVIDLTIPGVVAVENYADIWDYTDTGVRIV